MMGIEPKVASTSTAPLSELPPLTSRTSEADVLRLISDAAHDASASSHEFPPLSFDHAEDLAKAVLDALKAAGVKL